MTLIRTRPREEIVDGLTDLSIRLSLGHEGEGASMTLLREAVALLDGSAWPIDEVPPSIEEIDTPSARASDPETSKGFKTLTQASARGRLAWHFYNRTQPEPVGLTALEAVELADLTHQRSPWKRVSELLAVGIIERYKIVRDEQTGRDQWSYRITQLGMAMVEEMSEKGKVAVP